MTQKNMLKQIIVDLTPALLASIDPVCVIDAEGRLVYYNQALENVFTSALCKYSIGTKLFDLIKLDDNAGEFPLGDYLKTNKPFSLTDSPARMAGKELVLSMRLRPILAPGAPADSAAIGAVVILRVTHRHVMLQREVDLLVEQISQQVRMEGELATARVVQNRFFPPSSLSHPNLNLAGAYIPATECGGDWWYFFQFSSQVFHIIADVTGHGASAAMVTATVRGAFEVLRLELNNGAAQNWPIEKILGYFDQTVRATGGGDTLMTFLFSHIELQTGVLTLANASHPAPYLFRPKEGKYEYKRLIGPITSALGSGAALPVELSRIQLEPGDRLLWTTDGLLDCPNDSGQTMKKLEFLQQTEKVIRGTPANSERICAGIMKNVSNFLGSRFGAPVDDISLVVGAVPENVRFK